MHKLQHNPNRLTEADARAIITEAAYRNPTRSEYRNDDYVVRFRAHANSFEHEVTVTDHTNTVIAMATVDEFDV